MARREYQTIGVKEIASAADVSVQSIYNLVGSRHEAIAQGVCEHIGLIALHARESRAYPAYPLAIADICWRYAMTYPDYMRHAAKAYYWHDQPLSPDIERANQVYFGRLAKDLAAKQFRDGLDIPNFNRAFTAVVASIMLDWAQGRLSSQALRKELHTSCGLLMLGAIRPDRYKELESWLDKQ